MVDGEKMSKSKGNLYTIQELIEKGFGKNAIRYALISSHYRQNYNFTFDGLKAAQQAIDKINQCVLVLSETAKTQSDLPIRDQVQNIINNGISGFDEALCDDLNISKALGAVFDFIREVNKLEDVNSTEAKAVIEAIEKIDSVLGITEKISVEIPPEIIEKAEKRKAAKLNKDWDLADSARAEIMEEGFIIEDTPDGYRLKPMGG
jgi:cysteinyl-tRNA synthetase